MFGNYNKRDLVPAQPRLSHWHASHAAPSEDTLAGWLEFQSVDVEGNVSALWRKVELQLERKSLGL